MPEDISSLPSNSHNGRRGEPEKPSRVVEGEVIQRKKSPGKKLSQLLFADTAKGVASYLILDVLLPSAKDLIAELVNSAVNRAIYGDGRPTSRRGAAARTGSYVNYGGYSRGTQSTSIRREEPRTQMSQRAREMHDFDEIVIPTRAEAEEVLSQLNDRAIRYGSATVGDLYQMCGATPKYTDDKWGWKNLDNVGVARTRDGYVLNLPQPEPLN